MQRARLADFLRTRREALQPEDVGLPRGSRRRTGGLRREEVAALSAMSTDYYSRIEQQRGPQPSEQMLAAIARALRLTDQERDHLLRLGGYAVRPRVKAGRSVNPGMQRIFENLPADAAALVVSDLGETLRQTPLARELLGDGLVYEGLSASLHYRWFDDPAVRRIHPADDHATVGRELVADLLRIHTRDGENSRAGDIVRTLLARSPEFAALWREHPVPGPACARKRFTHPETGALDLDCQTLVDPDQSQSLLVYTAPAGSVAAQKLRRIGLHG
ncbi:helix-turn-helix transcriptional regulator [Herbidospora sp. NBRC 101105]|uniref:helix-turn-helix transcriptional regulator n=1 Tax=Herbidospora sp. NBRC 101105 TaxID=3032195 RepID=UPI0024A41F49|nr:helix-turn-helix transcriptional regulator [Herbidospora sp. NBRC 101105]GLX95394.1 DNA-binding protein [Herbidospora sp. NBRC 101105]